MPSSDRQQRWPRFASQARKRTLEAADDHADLLRQTLHMLAQIHAAAHTDPHLVAQLAILAQRDIALAVAAFADIHSWMVDADRGREREEGL